MFATQVTDGILQAHVTGNGSDSTADPRWLATGQGGGYANAPVAYNVSVPEGFNRTDLDAYVTERCEDAGFAERGPAMLTGVDLSHARGASAGPVRVVATAGVSNPATLQMEPDDWAQVAREDGEDWRPGTVNLLVGTTRALTDGGLATLLGTVVEAKTATLLATTGFTGTTSDAATVGCVDGAEPAAFAGSATEVGDAARACVREAVRASLASRYGDGTGVPESVADADHGVETTRTADRFQP